MKHAARATPSPAPIAVAEESSSHCSGVDVLECVEVDVASVLVVVEVAEDVPVLELAVEVEENGNAGMERDAAPPEQQSLPESLQHQWLFPEPGQGRTKYPSLEPIHQVSHHSVGAVYQGGV